MADSVRNQVFSEKPGFSPAEVVKFAQALVRQPSVTGEEGVLGRFLARALDDFGLRVELQEVAAGRYNVLAVLPGDDPDLGLLFHAHMDTVPYGAMPDPLSAEVTDDHIWGRGSVDQKGGLAAAVMALASIARSGVHLKSSLGLALVVDEESEHRGSMALVEQITRESGRGEVRQAVVTEPSGLRLVIGCKGTLPFQIRVQGKAAHGARPWLGVNAVHQAIQVVRALEELDYPVCDVPGYGPVKGSLNLGVVKGGRAYNIVPDECLLWFDRRTVPGEEQGVVLGAVQAILDRLAESDPPVASTQGIARPDWNWEPIRERGLHPAVTPAGAPIRDMVARHHSAVIGCPVEVYFTDGYNEMDFLINDLDIPTVQYGPGDSHLCHTDEERLSIPQLLDATRVYVGLALEAAEEVELWKRDV
ncbi:MAG: M20 family metallopeptidase [Chloroflexota bacterium]|nr:M20 family metallopeptidase [Chloroflexota bacterium]